VWRLARFGSAEEVVGGLRRERCAEKGGGIYFACGCGLLLG